MSSTYKEFGELVATLRVKAGLTQQSDLAKLLSTSQQTVSRWELGVSRPRQTQIALIAKALSCNVNDLLRAAGYVVQSKPVVVSFDQAFPIDSLTAESFERFCVYLLSFLYPEAKVHRAGGPGHKQDGLDIELALSDGTHYSFQCKRVEEFGPSKILAAIGAHTRVADKKYLLLSRIASPKARRVLDDHTEWELWDKEDISRIVRQYLSPEQRVRLVDTFFPGQRLALLGETEYGPWQKTEEFFAPFEDASAAFSHAWDLIGREAELVDVLDGFSRAGVGVVFLAGAGGRGKSRLLKESVELYEKSNPGVTVRFLAPSQELTVRSLHELGAGPKLLIVDDAHDRLDLTLLFQFVAAKSNNARLVLATRPYGLPLVKNQAASFSLMNESTAVIELEPLTIEQAEALSAQVLEHFYGPANLAKQIARMTHDCSLATVIASHVVAKDGAHFNRLTNEETFRSALMSKFQQVIAGKLGSKVDDDAIKKLLRIVALTQPFNPFDESFATLVETIEGIGIPETNKLIRNLSVGGVLFKCGRRYRLSPDMLSDFIIEDACVAEDGRSTGYAEQVFAHANLDQTKNLLVNMGKIDWRRSQGNPNDSSLLADLWCEIGDSDNYLDAVTEVAYYQPRRSLDYAERLIREGRVPQKLTKLIKYAGYDIDHLPRACECLWEIGKNDSRRLNQHPDHAIRILKELCEPERNKPLEHNEVLVDFAISLLFQDDAWGYAYTPFDILQGILETEGGEIVSEGPTTVFEKFLINPKFVAKLRLRAIEAAIVILTGPNRKRALLAAAFLGRAFRFPVHGISDELRQEWTEQFCLAFKNILEAIDAMPLEPLVYLELLDGIHWLIQCSDEDLANLVKHFVALPNESIEFRLTRALVDTWSDLHELNRRQQQDVADWSNRLAEELLYSYPDPKDLWQLIDKQLNAIKEIAPDKLGAGHNLITRVVDRATVVFAEEILENSLVDDKSNAALFAGIPLSKLLREKHQRAQEFVKRLLVSHSPQHQVAVARAYMWSGALRFGYSDEDLSLFRELLQCKNDWVVDNSITTLYIAGPSDPEIIIDLCKSIEIKRCPNVADAALGLLCHHKLIERLSVEDIEFFLDQLRNLPDLEGHWTQTVLSELSFSHAELMVKFFFGRVERAADACDWNFCPCNHGTYEQVPMKFIQSGLTTTLLGQFANWVTKRSDDLFRYRAAQLFETMFCPMNDEVLQFFEKWITRSTKEDIQLIIKLLSLDAKRIIFEHRHVVQALLQRAKQYGREVEGQAVSKLSGGAISGLRSGKFGEAFPEDIEMRDKCDMALKTVSRFNPEYRLFELLKKNAEREILSSVREIDDYED